MVQRGPITLDVSQHLVRVGGQKIELPPCAFTCLLTLARAYPKPVSYKELAVQSLGANLAALDAQDYARWRLERLRKALEPVPDRPRYLISVPGYGYRLKIS